MNVYQEVVVVEVGRGGERISEKRRSNRGRKKEELRKYVVVEVVD